MQKTVDLLGVRPLAQRVFRRIYACRYADCLSRAVQNGREWWLHPEVALRGEFQEFETIQWLREVIRPGDTVIDVGANVGQMTLEMAYLVGPSGKVIAIEPGPGNIRVLRQHIEANGFVDRVNIIEAACADVDGRELPLMIFGDSSTAVGNGHTLIVHRKLTKLEEKLQTTIHQISTVSLDALCRRQKLHPQVIKIDVEGAELMVLEGARHTLGSLRPALRFAFHPVSFSDPLAGSLAIRQLLKEFEYRIPGDNETQSLGLAEYVAIPGRK